MHQFSKSLYSVSICISMVLAGATAAQAQQASQATLDEYRTTLDRYCVTCHNETLKTANLILDTANVRDLSESPETWEKVITKLRLRSMPPVGMPRPDESFYNSFTSHLKGELDRLAQINPNPGKEVTAHRLNRTEYTNAVRDLMGVEIDGAAMLPADNSGVLIIWETCFRYHSYYLRNICPQHEW
jgi:cytochrome c5